MQAPSTKAEPKHLQLLVRVSILLLLLLLLLLLNLYSLKEYYCCCGLTAAPPNRCGGVSILEKYRRASAAVYVGARRGCLLL